MKKSKLLKFFVIIFSLFMLAGCTTNFCTNEDIEAIQKQIVLNIDEGNEYATGDYAKPDAAGLSKAGINVGENTIVGASSTYTITLTENTWEEITALDEEAENYLKMKYASYVYTTFHPKACLTTHDHADSATGANIKGKTFGDAANDGLLELIAYPVGFLFVEGAKILGGGVANGYTICLSIIIVTILIRVIIMLATFKSSKQTQQMQAIQPELDAINSKYADRTDNESKNAKAMEMMNIYKKYDINPLSSLITPFITLPIFIATYSAVKDSTAIFEGSIFGLELGQKLSTGILNFNWFAISIFVFMGIAQFVSMKIPQWLNQAQTPDYKKKKNKGGFNQGQIMTYFFLVMIIVIAWMLPIAMSIYWVASSLFSILQAVIMNKINKKQKKEENHITVKGTWK